MQSSDPLSLIMAMSLVLYFLFFGNGFKSEIITKENLKKNCLCIGNILFNIIVILICLVLLMSFFYDYS